MTFDFATMLAGSSGHLSVQLPDNLELTSLFTGEVTVPACFDDIMAQITNPNPDKNEDTETKTTTESDGVFSQVQIVMQNAVQTYFPVMMPIQFSLQLKHASQIPNNNEPEKITTKTEPQPAKINTDNSISTSVIHKQSLPVNTFKSIPQTIAQRGQPVAQMLPESSITPTSIPMPTSEQSQTNIRQKPVAITDEISVNKNVVATVKHQPEPVINRETELKPVMSAVKNLDIPQQVTAQEAVHVQDKPSYSSVKNNTPTEKIEVKSSSNINSNFQAPQVNIESPQQDNQKIVSVMMDNAVVEALQNEPQQPLIKVSARPGSVETIPILQTMKNTQPVSEVVSSTVPATQTNRQIPVTIPASETTQISTPVSNVIADVVPDIEPTIQDSTISQSYLISTKNKDEVNYKEAKNAPIVEVLYPVASPQYSDTQQIPVLENEVLQQPITQTNYSQIADKTPLRTGTDIHLEVPVQIEKNEITNIPVAPSDTVETVLQVSEVQVAEQIHPLQTILKNNKPSQLAQPQNAEIITGDRQLQNEQITKIPSAAASSDEAPRVYVASQINTTQYLESSKTVNELNVASDISKPVLPEKNPGAKPVNINPAASIEIKPERSPAQQVSRTQPQSHQPDSQTTADVHEVIQRVIAPLSRPVHETQIVETETRLITQEKLPGVIPTSQTQKQQLPQTVDTQQVSVEIQAQQISQPVVQIEKNNTVIKAIEMPAENIVQAKQPKNYAQRKFYTLTQPTVLVNEAQVQNLNSDGISTSQKETTQTFNKVSQQSQEALPAFKTQPVITHFTQPAAASPTQTTEDILPVQNTSVWPQMHTEMPATNIEVNLPEINQPVPAEMLQQKNSIPEVIINELPPVTRQVSEPVTNIDIPEIQLPQSVVVETQQQHAAATSIPTQNTLEPTIITRETIQIAERKPVDKDEPIISPTGQPAPISTVRPIRSARQNSIYEPTVASSETPVTINNFHPQATPAHAELTLPAQVKQQPEDNEISKQPMFPEAFNQMPNGAIAPAIQPDMDMTHAANIQPQRDQQLEPLLLTNQPVLIEVPSENDEIPSVRIELEQGQASIELQHNQPVENMHWRTVEPQIRDGLQKHGFELQNFNSQFSGNGTTPQDTHQPSQETFIAQDRPTTTHDTIKTPQLNTRKGSISKQSEGMDIFV